MAIITASDSGCTNKGLGKFLRYTITILSGQSTAEIRLGELDSGVLQHVSVKIPTLTSSATTTLKIINTIGDMDDEILVSSPLSHASTSQIVLNRVKVHRNDILRILKEQI